MCSNHKYESGKEEGEITDDILDEKMGEFLNNFFVM